MAKPLHYAGATSCSKCHEEQFTARTAVLTGTLAVRTVTGRPPHTPRQEGSEAPKPRDREFCLGCHAYQSARPNGFPQVDPRSTSRRSAACHATTRTTRCLRKRRRTAVAATDELSAPRHFPSTRCCRVPSATKVAEQHMISRGSIADQPDSREFCGRCHAAGSEDPARPGPGSTWPGTAGRSCAGNAITPTCPRDPNEQA